jgi:hypothetical protein
MEKQNTSTNNFTQMKLFSPAAFIIAFLGFFLTFTDINCNGTTIDSVTGFEFVKGYSADLDSGDTATEGEKYNPDLFLVLAMLSALAGIVFYFIKKLRINYRLNAVVGLVGFICLILFMIEMQNTINSIDPEKNLSTETFVDLQAEMKIGFWLVTISFLLAAAWNWMKLKEPDASEKEDIFIPEDLEGKEIDQL